MRSFLFVMATVVLAVSTAIGQSGDIAKQIYSSSQDSVFLVYLNDSSGSPSALGSAFLVAPRLLITNAHVAEAGKPVLAVGPVRIPLKILRTDEKNDLAILSVDVDLTSKPLSLAKTELSPGEQIFAIGNPEGLEKTISQGIVSGLRKRDDRNLIQITCPISHGSSGGPILNAKGEVVGVAVGMLEDGQNLNFAVPVAYVRSILEEKTNTTSSINMNDSLTDTKNLLKKRSEAEYSDDPSSDYQQVTHKLLNLMGTVIASTSREDMLTEMACLGTKAFDLSDAGISAARKLLREKPSSGHRALLSYVLYDRASDENFRSLIAQKDSDDQVQATAAHEKFLTEAGREAAEASRTAKGKDLMIANFVLGNTKRDLGEYSEAILLHSQVASGNPQVCGNDIAEQAISNLIYENDRAKKPDDAERWFKKYVGLSAPSAYEWDSEGDRRRAVNDFVGSVSAYENAAKTGTYYNYDYCYAAIDNYLKNPIYQDGVLADGRKCVEESVNNTVKSNERHFTSTLPIVYSDMADILEQRGVYQPALEYAKESLAVKPDDPFVVFTEAKVFEDLQRYTECIAASQAAIRASDGKYSWIQFQLGQCYFDTEDWNNAATYYRLAAEADKTDAASAFNLGLSLARQGYTSDANQWFREALNRKPSDELRAKILHALK